MLLERNLNRPSLNSLHSNFAHSSLNLDKMHLRSIKRSVTVNRSVITAYDGMTLGQTSVFNTLSITTFDLYCAVKIIYRFYFSCTVSVLLIIILISSLININYKYGVYRHNASHYDFIGWDFIFSYTINDLQKYIIV